MRKIYTILIAVQFVFIGAYAQTSGGISGKLSDSTNLQILKGATLLVRNPKDSAIVKNAISGDGGAFNITDLPFGEYIFQISFEGYRSRSRKITITAVVPLAELGTIYLKPKDNELAGVVVEAAPVKMKKDTVEYNAGSFATKPNAVAEDLLKKLPGMQVDKSGTITSQGETVTRVMVDGKRFFSDDPKLATRNLPPDVIDKIQVFDDLSDQSKFTGFDDGNRVKTINIVTRKDRREGYFGKAVAGVGTNENYDESVNFHRFKGTQQISLLGQANDVNKQNFSIQDVLGNSGGRRAGGGNNGGTGAGSAGITTVWAGGLNYRDSWGKNVDVSGSYFYNSQHVTTSQQSFAQKNITSDSLNFVTSDQATIQRTQNHRVSLNIEARIDSSNSLVFRPNVVFQTTTPNSSSTTSTVDNNGNPVYSSMSHSFSTNSGYNINGTNLQFRHKFAKPFQTFSVDLNLSASDNNGDGRNYSINHFSQPFSRIDTINQYYNDSSHSISFSPTFSFTQPVGKNQILELNYNYAYNKNTNINNTYSYSNVTKGFNVFDSLFSNSYRFTSNSNRFTLNYRIQNAKYNFNVGSGVQFLDFNSLNTTKNVLVSHTYVNLTPQANFQYKFSNTKNLRFFYSGRTGNPSANQLQPITTASADSINFQIGNPSLKPQFTHSIRALFSSFDPVTQNVIFATINASTTVNDIQSSIIQNRNGGRTSSYVNLDGTYNISGFFNYGLALKKPKSNLNFITNVNYNQSQSLIDTTIGTTNLFVHDYTKNTTLSETISWTTNIKNNFDMNFSSASTYNIARNSLYPKQNLNYYTQVLSAEITAYTTNGWLIATNFDYTYSGNRSAGYNTSVPLLTPSIAKTGMFKKKNGEIRLTIFDLLNQNTAVTRTVSTSQVIDTKTNVLSRYAMLTFTYNLNNFGGNQQKRAPGMFPRMPGGGGGRGGGGFGGGGRQGGGGGPDF